MTNFTTDLVALAAFGVLCIVLGTALATTVQSAIERRRDHHTHAPDPPWPARPLTRDDTRDVQSHR